MLSLVTLEDKFDLTCAVTHWGGHKGANKAPAVSNQKSAMRLNPWRFLFIVVAGTGLRRSNVRLPIWDRSAVQKFKSFQSFKTSGDLNDWNLLKIGH
jgi:hypothetical protein